MVHWILIMGSYQGGYVLKNYSFFQEVEVHLTPTTAPRLMTVEAVPGNFPQPLVMDPGRWSVSFENNQNFFLVCIVTQEQNIVSYLC